MASYRKAYEVESNPEVFDFGFKLPSSKEDGSGREYFAMYSQCKFASELFTPTAAPASGGHADIGGQFIQIIGT